MRKLKFILGFSLALLIVTLSLNLPVLIAFAYQEIMAKRIELDWVFLSLIGLVGLVVGVITMLAAIRRIRRDDWQSTL